MLFSLPVCNLQKLWAEQTLHMKMEYLIWKLKCQRGIYYEGLICCNLYFILFSDPFKYKWLTLSLMQVPIWASKNQVLNSYLPPQHWQLGPNLPRRSETPTKGCHLLQTELNLVCLKNIQAFNWFVSLQKLKMYPFNILIGCLETIP